MKTLPDLIIDGVDLLRDPNTVNVLSFSGGKDSVAMYLLAIENGLPFAPVCADTGNEHELTLEYVRGFHLQSGGPEVRVIQADFSQDFAHRREFVASNPDLSDEQKTRIIAALQPTGNPFLDLSMLKGRFASAIAAFCTEKLKRDPIFEQVFFPLLDAAKTVVSWQGVRAEESARRAAYPIYDTPGGGLWNYRPIHQWSAADTFAIMARHGVTPNPLYKMGMARVGCMPCVNCRKDELYEIANRFPEHIDRIREWEHIVTMCSKKGLHATFFHSSKFSDGNYHGIDSVVEWSRTGKGGRTFDFFKHIEEPTACASAYGLCES